MNRGLAVTPALLLWGSGGAVPGSSRCPCRSSRNSEVSVPIHKAPSGPRRKTETVSAAAFGPPTRDHCPCARRNTPDCAVPNSIAPSASGRMLRTPATCMPGTVIVS